MPFGYGRGYRRMYYATGLPGWARAGYGYPAFGAGFGGNPYQNCRVFPWLPRRWWSGSYGPVQWTEQGPQIAAQQAPQAQQPQPQMPQAQQPQSQMAPAQFPFQQPTKDQEIQLLQQQLKAIEDEKKLLEQDVEEIKKRMDELKKQK